MAGIIKSLDSKSLPAAAPFNFDDMAIKANGYLDNVRREAGKIVLAAKQEAEQVRKQALAEARKAAQEEAEKSVATRVAQQLEPALVAVRKAAGELQQAKTAWLRQWEGEVVRLAAAMAAKITRRELEQEPKIALKLLREALELATGCGEIEVHLHPDDRRALGPEADKLVQELAKLGPSAIVADAAVGRGGCRIVTKFGVIDQQIEAQLARIVEELT